MRDGTPLLIIRGRMGSRDPNVLALAVASAWLAMSMLLHSRLRRYEIAHGSLTPGEFYTPSISGAEGMLGRRALVRKACSPEGTIEVGPERWNARSLRESTIPSGQTVVVRDMDGLCLLVEREPHNNAIEPTRPAPPVR